MDVSEIARLLSDGQLWQAAGHLSALSEAGFPLVAKEVCRAGAGDSVQLMNDLLTASAPAAADIREKLVGLEALRHLAAHVALESTGENWEDLIPVVRTLGRDASFRVREALVKVISRISSETFEKSRGFWHECLTEEGPELGSLVLRGLAASQAPVTEVLDVFAGSLSDLRRDIRHSLGPRAIPALGCREPRAVYQRLREWASRADEIARWHVARALATPLGGVYVEDAVDILEILAADERPSVWRAAAAALIEIAQRRPSYVLPILGRWRTDPRRERCARLALETLAKR